MTDNSNKPGDRANDGVQHRPDKVSDNLSKDAPEVSHSNVRAAQRVNLNRTDTVSPDGKSRFCLTDDGAGNHAKAVQEKAYRDAGLGDPHKPIGKQSEDSIDSQKTSEQASKTLNKLLESGKLEAPTQKQETPGHHRVDEAIKSVAHKLDAGSLYNGLLPERPAPRENPVAAAGDFIKHQLIEHAKGEVGHVHGTINFAVNTLSGLGDLVRMGAAANRELSPLSLISKDIDPEGTKKLHEACSGLAVGSRVLLQYSTTFNPSSPLFRVNFDPEGSQMAMKLALNMPGKLKQEIDDYGKLDTEAKSAKSTELMLNIASLAAGGLGAASKGSELSNVGTAAKTLEELSGAAKVSEMANEGKFLANVAKDVQSFLAEQSKHLDQIAKAFDNHFPRFPQNDMLPADGPPIRYVRENEQPVPGGKKDDNVVFSTADKGGDGLPRNQGRPESMPEKIPLPSERFVAEVKQATETLSEGELANLKLHGIEIQPVRRLTDVMPGTEKLGAFYSPEHKTIFVPEEILRLGRWVPNDDVPFALNHEVGHVFNAKADNFGEYVSNFEQFRDIFQQDQRSVPSNVLDSLQLSSKGIVARRDEVFADLYAHAKGLKSNNPYSQQIKQWFRNSLKYVEEIPKW